MVVWACGQKSHEHDHGHEASQPVSSTGNEALYNEVMKIHDEVMPKSNDIYTLKQELSKKLAETPAPTEEKKKEIEASIAKLDSADAGMMEWMHKFNPLPDSLGEEKAREYLETEMEKIKGVRENILEALEAGKAVK